MPGRRSRLSLIDGVVVSRNAAMMPGSTCEGGGLRLILVTAFPSIISAIWLIDVMRSTVAAWPWRTLRCVQVYGLSVISAAPSKQSARTEPPILAQGDACASLLAVRPR